MDVMEIERLCFWYSFPCALALILKLWSENISECFCSCGSQSVLSRLWNDWYGSSVTVKAHLLFLLRLLVPYRDIPSHMLGTHPNVVRTNAILKGPVLRLRLTGLVVLLVGGVAGWKSHLSAVSATQAKANKMWTKLNFSINGIIPRLMCCLLEQNTRSIQGQTSGCWLTGHVGTSLVSQSRLIQISVWCWIKKIIGLSSGSKISLHAVFTCL